jgi:creatinine amidohydrolase
MTASKGSRAPEIAVLPLGATEQHGPHLPVETDAIIAAGVAERLRLLLGAPEKVAFLPVEEIGYSPEHMDFPGTRSLSYAQAIERWIGIGEKAHADGIRKFVMLNAHGGNSPLMTIVATELRVRLGMLAVATSWTRFGYPEDLVSHEERAIGIHGGFIETSVMLALRPDLVDMGKAREFSSAQTRFAEDFTHLRAYGPHAFGWKMNDLSPDGVTGNAAAATAEAGERILDHAVAGLAELIKDVQRFDLAALR